MEPRDVELLDLSRLEAKPCAIPMASGVSVFDHAKCRKADSLLIDEAFSRSRLKSSIRPYTGGLYVATQSNACEVEPTWPSYFIIGMVGG
jgi:hypothetical protein